MYDFQTIQPWHWGSLSSALITIILFLILDHYTTREKHGEHVTENYPIFKIARVLDRLRMMAVIYWVLVAFYFAIGHFLASCHLPLWLSDLLILHYSQPEC